MKPSPDAIIGHPILNYGQFGCVLDRGGRERGREGWRWRKKNLPKFGLSISYLPIIPFVQVDRLRWCHQVGGRRSPRTRPSSTADRWHRRQPGPALPISTPWDSVQFSRFVLHWPNSIDEIFLIAVTWICVGRGRAGGGGGGGGGRREGDLQTILFQLQNNSINLTPRFSLYLSLSLSLSLKFNLASITIQRISIV